jgi:hypothetical protein
MKIRLEWYEANLPRRLGVRSVIGHFSHSILWDGSRNRRPLLATAA